MSHRQRTPHSGERERDREGGRQGDLTRPDDPIKNTSRPSVPELVGHSTFLSAFPPFRAAADSFAPGSPARRSSEMANSASGVAVNDECKLKFIELKSKRLHRFITYRMDDKMREIIVEKVGDRETSYEEFTGSLPENDCRFAIYDFDFTTAEDVPKSRIFYILWSPDTARVRSKMLYASSNEKFKRELDGIQVELQATDASDISIDAIKDRAR